MALVDHLSWVLVGVASLAAMPYIVPVATAEVAIEEGEAGEVATEVVAVVAAHPQLPLPLILTARLLGLLLGKPSLSLRTPLRQWRWGAALRLPDPSSSFLLPPSASSTPLRRSSWLPPSSRCPSRN